MLRDERTDSHSRGRPGYEFILVSGECQAWAGEFRDSLSLGPPTNAAIKGQSGCGSTLRGFRFNIGQGLGILATKRRPAATDKGGEPICPGRKLQADNAAKRKPKPRETVDAGCICYGENIRAEAVGGQRRDVGRGIVSSSISDDDDAIVVGERIVIAAGLSLEHNQRWP